MDPSDTSLHLPKVGLIGVGLMGHGLGKNLIDAGLPLAIVAHQRRDRVEELLERGASESPSIIHLAKQSDIVIGCLPSMQAIESVLPSVISNIRPGATLIDCSTTDPTTTARLGAEAKQRNVDMIDAPMLSGPDEAWEGSITLLVGGTDDAISKCRPIFNAVAGKVIHIGQLGSAHTVKLLNNAITMSTTALLSEVFALAAKKQVDLRQLYDILCSGYAASPRLIDLGRRVLEDDHDVAVAIDVCLKDISLYNKLAVDAGTLTFVGQAARNAFLLAARLGHGGQNFSRMPQVLATLSGANLESVASSTVDDTKS